MSVTLAIDAMGGDHGVVVTVPAACDFLEKHADVKIALVGDPDLIKQVLSKSSKAPMERIQIIPASEVVLMDDPIEVALRRKKRFFNACCHWASKRGCGRRSYLFW